MPHIKPLRDSVFYMSHVGLLAGLRLYLRSHRPSWRRKDYRFRLPELQHPIHLRLGGSDLAVFEQVFVTKQYDIVRTGSAPNTIVDAGANIGMSSLYFHLLFPDAKIWAIEPDRDNFELLAENCGPYKNITCLLAGLAATECTLTISNKTSASPWALRTTPAESSTDSLAVPGLTLSTILRQFGLQRIDLLKLDIEGAEREIFECSDLSWLDHVGAIAIELHDYLTPGCARAFFSAVTPRMASCITSNEIALVTLLEPETLC